MREQICGNPQSRLLSSALYEVFGILKGMLLGIGGWWHDMAYEEM